jgi:hypothetical protein
MKRFTLEEELVSIRQLEDQMREVGLLWPLPEAKQYAEEVKR